jgi:hypothetical protein
MHINELQSIVRRLSNQCWVRWWANYYNTHNNVKMAIQCLDVVPCMRPTSENPGCWPFMPIYIKDLEWHMHRQHLVDERFELLHPWQPNSLSNYIYLISRTNEDGTPFISNIF